MPNKKASRNNSRGTFKSSSSCLFLHKLQSTDRVGRLYSDEIHAIVQAFKVESGQPLGVALLIDLLSHAVKDASLAVFLRQVDAELSVVRVGVEDDAVHCGFLCDGNDIAGWEDDVVDPSAVAATAVRDVFVVDPF